MKRFKKSIAIAITGGVLALACVLPVSAQNVQPTETENNSVTYAVVENGERCLATTNTAKKAEKIVELNKDYCDELTIIKFDKSIKEMTLEKVEKSL